MSDYIIGRNPILSYLESQGQADKLYIQKGNQKGAINKIIQRAKDLSLPITEVDKQKLDQLAQGQNHQGVVLLAPDFLYASLEEILNVAKEREEDPFLILLDEIKDPHNLGAIIRTAECVGAHGLIIPKRRSASVNATVHKTSSGATSFLKVAKVTNLNQCIEELKKENIWVYGAAGEAEQNLWQTDFSGGLCLVIGDEGKGISKLTRERCDFLVSIPMKGQTESLNASTSAAVLMYEVLRQRSMRPR